MHSTGVASLRGHMGVIVKIVLFREYLVATEENVKIEAALRFERLLAKVGAARGVAWEVVALVLRVFEAPVVV